MVGLIPRLFLPLPAICHSPFPIFFHAGRPSADPPTSPFHFQCDGEAAPAGSPLRVALASGVPPCPGGRSGGLLLPTGTLLWPAAPTGAATAAGAAAAAGCPPSSSFLTSCRFASSLPAVWPPASETSFPGDSGPACTGGAETSGATGATDAFGSGTKAANGNAPVSGGRNRCPSSLGRSRLGASPPTPAEKPQV